MMIARNQKVRNHCNHESYFTSFNIILVFVFCSVQSFPEVIRDPREYTVLCNDKNPVWICEHTMDNRHPCRYLLCKDCFYDKMKKEAVEGNTKRIRSVVEERENINDKDYDDNEITEQAKCDHSCNNGLQVYTCNLYFTEQYIKKKSEEEDCYYPTNCAGCHKAVRDKYDSKKLVSV